MITPDNAVLFWSTSAYYGGIWSIAAICFARKSFECSILNEALVLGSLLNNIGWESTNLSIILQRAMMIYIVVYTI